MAAAITALPWRGMYDEEPIQAHRAPDCAAKHLGRLKFTR